MADEEKKKRRREQYRAYATSDAGRASQHARQKAYHERQKQAGKEYYRVTINVKPQYREIIAALCEQEHKTVSELFVSSVEEKYGVTIHKDNTTNS